MPRGLVCVPCMRFFRTKKVGVSVEEGMPVGPVQADGEPESWAPYKLWQADLCECPSCGTQILAGFGMGPIAEHYQRNYAQHVEIHQSIGRVDDCGGARP